MPPNRVKKLGDPKNQAGFYKAFADKTKTDEHSEMLKPAGETCLAELLGLVEAIISECYIMAR